MNKNNQKLLEKIVVFCFLIVGILIIIKVNVVYEERTEEIFILDRKIVEIKDKKGKESKLSTDLERIKRVISVELTDLDFSPNVINVNMGDEITIYAKVSEGYHNLNLDFYDLQSENIPTGKTGSIRFIATQSGTFRLFSSTGKYELPEPEALLIIKE